MNRTANSGLAEVLNTSDRSKNSEPGRSDAARIAEGVRCGSRQLEV